MAHNKARAKAKLLKELERMPIIEVACQRVGVSRATYYRWVGEDNKFESEVEQARERGVFLVNDMAESKLITDIKEGQPAAYKFWLSHRHRAYHSPAKARYEEKLNPQRSFPIALVEFIKPPYGKKKKG